VVYKDWGIKRGGGEVLDIGVSTKGVWVNT